MDYGLWIMGGVMKVAVISKSKKDCKMIKNIILNKWGAEFSYFLNLDEFNDKVEKDYDFLLADSKEMGYCSEETLQSFLEACEKNNIKMVVWKDLSQEWLISEIEKYDKDEPECFDEDELNVTEDLSKVVFKREKIIEKVEIIKEIYAPMPRTKIGLVGISEGAGATFLTLNLAKAITYHGMLPAVLECGNTDIYDKIYIKSRITDFFSFYDADDSKSIRNKENKSEGINWVLKDPQKEHNQLGKSIKILNALKDSIIFCDLSGIHVHSELFDMISEMDSIITIIDPLPSRMMKGYHLLKQINSLEMNVINVANKYNTGVNRKELIDFLGVKDLIYIPFVVPEDIYIAEYHYDIPYSISMIRQQIEKPVQEIIKKIIPSELLTTGDRIKGKNRFGLIKADR